jgi:HAD superfamily hydrolase (TIGR01509 family)
VRNVATEGIKGVLFDWDGVLLDSLPVGMSVYNRILPRIGVRPLTTEKFLELQSPNSHEFYSKLGIPNRMWNKLDDDWMRLYKEESPSLQPDTTKSLTALKKSGFRLALVSNGTRTRVEGELARFGLRRFFDVVCCGTRRNELKPSPFLLRRALRALGLRPKGVVYVGDSPVDIRASKSAGIPSVAIVRKAIQKKRLLLEKPDYCFANLEELLDFLMNRDLTFEEQPL